MSLKSCLQRLAGWWPLCAVVVCAAGLGPDARAAGKAAAHSAPSPPHAKSSPKVKAKPDLSGHQRVGTASVYAKKFTGKKMADGTRMNPHGDNAASKTLPLGTTARVTNLETGQSAKVTIQDRGPHVKGRIVDLSPSTARKIGIAKGDGVAQVKVEPIAVPVPDGSVKPGVAAKNGNARKPAFRR
ncbi:septal ring lytic transglycosylase RlpA family protein [Polaromonas glacialis]|uniref:septal ring lytic transglycosylase RlpA family protein n=1 Tax=Polaromonas glacialis TaxID=866564 RepID=UPI000691C31E|nr:septal ring lytic transglycosylase RlpA family protein [Polaromonas glacialis]